MQRKTVVARSLQASSAVDTENFELYHRQLNFIQDTISAIPITFSTSFIRQEEESQVQSPNRSDPFVTSLQEKLHYTQSRYQRESRRRRILQKLFKVRTPAFLSLKGSGGSPSLGITCPICVDNHCDYSLYCGHLFCEECINRWKGDSSKYPIYQAALKGYRIYL